MVSAATLGFAMAVREPERLAQRLERSYYNITAILEPRKKTTLANSLHIMQRIGECSFLSRL